MKKIYSYWLKMFYVYAIYFIAAVAVIFAVCAYSYRSYTVNVALQYSLNLLKTGEVNFDTELKQYAEVLHNVGAEKIAEITEKKAEYESAGLYEYDLSQALQTYANRIKGVSGVVFFDNDMQMVSVGTGHPEKFYDKQEKNISILEKLDGSEIWRCDGENIILCKKLYVYNTKLVPIGYIYVIINPDDVIKSCSEIKKSDDEYIILNDLDEVILSSDKSMIGKAESDIFKANKSQFEYNDTNYYIFKTKSKNCNLQYGYMMNIDSINKSERLVILRFLALILIFGIIILIKVKGTYKKQGVPINEITDCMREASRGNLKSRTTYNKNDEIGYLSVEFNNMMDKLDEQVNRIMEMEIQLKKSQLKAYESQINPHFLYNTLDLIRMMAMTEDADKIEEIIVALASMLRYNLSAETEVRICDEIKSIEDYFKILSMRFGDKFDYNIDVDDRIAKCKILKFIIQPLVENSVKHGIGRTEKPGLIEVACKLVGNEIAIIVSDNGIGMTRQQVEEIKTNLDSQSDEHIGIKNIYKRLKLFYGDKSIIEIYSEEDKGTRILLKIPYTETDGD